MAMSHGRGMTIWPGLNTAVTDPDSLLPLLSRQSEASELTGSKKTY